MNDYLILVDKNDEPQGKMEKDSVHRLGLLHRAFSIFIFNTKGELLLQQRADGKYHSAGLWTNSCCSHPRYGEDISDAIPRRLMEEMGMTCKTRFAFSFIYNASFDNGLTEHEFDHVYFGISDDLPFPEKSEVKNWKYIRLENLENHISKQPEIYTAWMKICLPQVKKYYKMIFEINTQTHASI